MKEPELTLPWAIDLIGQIPTFAADSFLDLLKPNQREFLNLMKNLYAAKSAWLRHFLLGENIGERVLESEWRYYQPHAELDKLLFDLCRDLYARDADLQVAFPEKNGAIVLWLECLTKEFGVLFIKETLQGRIKPSGKRRYYENNVKLLQDLEMWRYSLRGEGSGESIDFNSAPHYYLIHKAAALAKEDPSFTPIFDLYAKNRKVLTRQIYQTQELQPFFVNSNDDKVLGGQRGRLKGTNKGAEEL